MKISILSAVPKKNNLVIIPLMDDDQLKSHLAIIAESVGIKATILQNDFSANQEETYYLSTPATPKLILLGIGKTMSFSAVSKSFKLLSHRDKNKLDSNIIIDFTKVEETPEMVEASINGLTLGSYNVAMYKTDKADKHPLENAKATIKAVTSITRATAQKAIQKGLETALTQMSIMNLVNAPGNKATPEYLAQWAKNSGKKYGFKVKVLNKRQCLTEGLHALLAVNKGSEYPPTFIVMEYIPTTKRKYKKVGLVGKGVTFDTGGLSIKGSQNMHYMKCDMGGGAAVLGTMELAAKLKLPVHLIGIVPATDNCVDATAVKPGDVIQSYSKKTIEIIDTDAEGRLILADGIAYMNKKYKPNVLIDLATLTGSCVRALGYNAGGLFTNNDDLAKDLYEAGMESGEKLWRLPLWDDYKHEMNSDVADIKNFSGRPTAGAITAGKFLEFFTNKHSNWAHLDIAGVAFGDSGLSKEKSSTAYGIHLLVTYLKNKKW